jgi:hypothetical protein
MCSSPSSLVCVGPFRGFAVTSTSMSNIWADASAGQSPSVAIKGRAPTPARPSSGTESSFLRAWAPQGLVSFHRASAAEFPSLPRPNRATLREGEHTASETAGRKVVGSFTGLGET